MADLTSNPHASLQNQDDGVLNASLTASATSCTISAVKKWINGTLTTGGFDSTAGFVKIIDSTGRYEFASFNGKSVDANNVTTLSNMRRGLSPTTSAYTAGTGLAFDANSRIYVCDYALLYSSLVDTDGTQSITGTKTFTAPIKITGSTSYTGVPHMTTAQRTSLTPTQAGFVYDTDLSQVYKYEGGAWAAVATGTFSNAADGTAGKVDLATAAEVAAATANDASSGAANVIPVSIVKPTSTGAVSGSVPALNTSIMLDGSIGGLGVATPAVGKLLMGNGAGAAVTTIGPGSSNQVPLSNGTTIAMGNLVYLDKTVGVNTTDSSTRGASSTADFNFDNHTYSIPANDLIAGVAYEIEAIISMTWAAGNIDLFVQLGATKVLDLGDVTPSSTSPIILRTTVYGTVAAGASVTVRAAGNIQWQTSSNPAYAATAAIATNGTLSLQMGGAFRTSNGSNNMIMRLSKIRKISTTAF